MMMKRREFVAGIGSLVAAAGLPTGSLLAAAADVLDVRTVAFDGGLNRSKFAALVNQTFHIYTENDGAVIVRLVEVRDRATKKATSTSLEQFSLIFRGPALPALSGGAYEVEHWLAGKIRLYLEATLAASSESIYRADFSLLP